MKAAMERRMRERPAAQRERPLPIIGFAFSIDGVLGMMNEKLVFEGVIEALQNLQVSKIPFIFFTNVSGSERMVSNLLEKITGLHFEESQIIQSHTPFRDLAPQYRGKTVLVIGGLKHTMRAIAGEYGFDSVVTSSDLYRFRSSGSELPYHEPTAAYHNAQGYRDDHIPLDPAGGLKIDAILVAGTPRDWGFELQLIIDLLLFEKGYYGTVSRFNGQTSMQNNGYLQDDQPKLYFSNPELTFPSSGNPRLGQGSFQIALEAIWDALAGGAELLNEIRFGKPTQEAFSYAERALHKYHKAMHEKSSPNTPLPPIQKVYMVGDNPETDIAGANAFKSQYGWKWRSVLVETGLYEKGAEPSRRPHMLVPDFPKAVAWALKQTLRPLEFPGPEIPSRDPPLPPLPERGQFSAHTSRASSESSDAIAPIPIPKSPQ